VQKKISLLQNVQTGLLSSGVLWFFPGRENGRSFILTHPSSTEVKETVELPLYFPHAFMASARKTLPLACYNLMFF